MGPAPLESPGGCWSSWVCEPGSEFALASWVGDAFGSGPGDALSSAGGAGSGDGLGEPPPAESDVSPAGSWLQVAGASGSGPLAVLDEELLLLSSWLLWLELELALS
jgi:hypothetical protein